MEKNYNNNPESVNILKIILSLQSRCADIKCMFYNLTHSAFIFALKNISNKIVGFNSIEYDKLMPYFITTQTQKR